MKSREFTNLFIFFCFGVLKIENNFHDSFFVGEWKKEKASKRRNWKFWNYFPFLRSIRSDYNYENGIFPCFCFAELLFLLSFTILPFYHPIQCIFNETEQASHSLTHIATIDRFFLFFSIAPALFLGGKHWEKKLKFFLFEAIKNSWKPWVDILLEWKCLLL